MSATPIQAVAEPGAGKFVQYFGQFIRASCSRDVMADHAAKAVRFHRRHFLQHILNHRPANRDERVAVVEAERGEFVALAADVQSLAQGEFAGAGGCGRAMVFRRLGEWRRGNAALPFTTDVCLDLGDGRDAFAFEIATTGLRKQRFGHKTVLDAESFAHRRLQIFLHLSGRCHARNLAPEL